MIWWNRKPRYTLDEYNELYGMVADKVTAMNEEARKANMVEQGLLPQEHLSRADMLANLQRLRNEGHTGLGRRIAEAAEDEDLTARDD